MSSNIQTLSFLAIMSFFSIGCESTTIHNHIDINHEQGIKVCYNNYIMTWVIKDILLNMVIDPVDGKPYKCKGSQHKYTIIE